MRKETKNTKGRENVEQASNEMDNDLHELFLSEIADVHNAEKQLTRALPKMAKNANSDELREAFESHLQETEEHVVRLEKALKTLGEPLKRKTCAAMKGLIEEANELIEEEKDSSALDAALIAAGQKVEHYEIASYGTLRAWAEQMGHEECVELFEETLNEERAADEKLTSIGESQANVKAQAE